MQFIGVGEQFAAPAAIAVKPPAPFSPGSYAPPPPLALPLPNHAALSMTPAPAGAGDEGRHDHCRKYAPASHHSIRPVVDFR